MPGAETFRASAEVYDRLVGRYGTSLAAELIDFAQVEPGMRVLDVGCGPGALTAALADRVGDANVCAVDPSEPFVEACRARLPGVEVTVASAEALPFPDHAFDATLSQLAKLWRDVGLHDVRSRSLVAHAGYADFEDLWAPLPTGIAPAGAFTKSLDDERRAALHDALRRRLGVGEGLFELTARAWAAAGVVPDA